MKAKIRSLVSELTNLPQPHELDKLSSIFNRYADLFLKNVKPIEELATHWYALRNIRIQISEWQQLVNEQKALLNLKDKLDKLRSNLQLSSQQIVNTETQILEHKKIIERLYPSLLEQYNTYLITLNPITAISYPSNPQQQKNLILAYLETLKSQYTSLQLDEARLQLTDLLAQRSAVILQLKQLQIILSSSDLSELEKLHATIKLKRQTLNHLKVELEKIQQELAENISAYDVQQDVENKIHLIDTARSTLFNLQSKIEGYYLPLEVKNILADEYKKAKDKAKFISQKQQDLNWFASSWNPFAWYGWGTDANFQTSLAKKQSEFNYFQLLYQSEQITQEIEELKLKLRRTQNLILPTMKSLKLNTEPSLLHKQAVKLLTAYDSHYSIANVTSMSLLTDIIDNVSPIMRKIDQLDEILHLLCQLQELERTILQLRTTHSLMMDVTDLIPAKNEIISLQQLAPKRQSTVQCLANNIQSCTECVDSLNAINELEKQLKFNKDAKRHLKEEIKQAKINLIDYPNCSHHEIKKIQTQRCITFQIEALNKLAAILDEPASNENLPVVASKSAEFISYQDKLNSWNRLIRNVSISLPIDLSEWYHQLFIALQSQVNDEATFNQACQLLRDILFEVQYPVEKDHFSVIQAYQRMCPEPSLSWKILTNLKPMLPVCNTQLAAVSNKKLGAKLDALYQQQAILEKKHPREAELLLQATQTLHQATLLADSNSNHYILKNLTPSIADPRYESLQRHRGFFKICEWLAELCASLLALIKNKSQKENDYRQLFFFKPTHSAQLLTTATMDIVSCAANLSG